MPLQIRRGTNAERNALPSPLAEGEIVFVTDYQEEGVSPLWIGDGDTIGGVEINTSSNIGGGIVEGENYRINIIGSDSGVIVDSSAGTLFGDLTGDVTGDLTGDVFGNLFGNVDATTISVSDFIASSSSTVSIGSTLAPSAINITTNNSTAAAFNGVVAPDSPLYVDVNASRGTVVLKTPPLAGDELGGYRIQSWNGSAYVTNAVVQAEIIPTADMLSDNPASALIIAVANNTTFSLFRFSPSGNLSVPGGVRVGSYTSSPDTRPSGTAAFNGLMIYDATTNKFQGYANGVWVDFH